MRAGLLASAAAALTIHTASAAEPATLQVTVVPSQPLLERTLYGIQPGITIVPNRKVAAGGGLTLFNPFHTLAAQWPLASLDYTFRFADEKGGEAVQTLRVTPKPYATQTRLRLPLDGRLLVWDGHDFYSHHRRWDLDHPVAVQIGFDTNASRYSYDFTVVDTEGRRYRGEGAKHEDHFSYGKPVLAPGDGEFSHLGHLKPGSVKVAVGDKVRAGQAIAQVGTSGSSLFPHLHYELATSAGTDDEGLPSQFVDFDRVLGSSRARADGTSPDSGDIVEAR